MEPDKFADFRGGVWQFYREHGRPLPWRRNVTPYGVFVSEVMLQQTQVSRVQERWERWLERWPNFEALAEASVAEVLSEWQGLGYNRRALRVREAAQMVVRDFGASLPSEVDELVTLPGIGANTAGSMVVFAYNVPVVFIETNIRRVFIHHFDEMTGPGAMKGSSRARQAEAGSGHDEFSFAPPGISDAQLRPLIAATLDAENPREWYWTLMDYGADLAKRGPNPNRRSKHYNVKSKFEGSLRQLRGEVLRQLLAGDKSAAELGIDDERLAVVLEALVKEGFLVQVASRYGLAK